MEMDSFFIYTLHNNKNTTQTMRIYGLQRFRQDVQP